MKSANISTVLTNPRYQDLRYIFKNGGLKNICLALFWFFLSFLKIQDLRSSLLSRARNYEDWAVSPTDMDWDNMIILDACRFDEFLRVVDLPGESFGVVSPGNSSMDYIRSSFSGQDLRDTIYVTANPHHYLLEEPTFFKVVDATLFWDYEYGITLPDVLVRLGEEIKQEYPNKRYIFHFMQPHQPYIGSTWSKLITNPRQAGLKETQHQGISPWTAVKTRLVTDDQLKKAYRENIVIVNYFVNKLIPMLDGKTVVTADHGENLGEKYYNFSLYGHGHDSLECRLVPWHILPHDERKKVRQGIPSSHNPDVDIARQKLSALGYI